MSFSYFSDNDQLMWRLKLIPEDFMVKNFAFDQFNIREHRYHTLLTHAFSHFGMFSFGTSSFNKAFDTLLFVLFGSALRLQYGNKVVYSIYLISALTSGLAMTFARTASPFVKPEVGSDVVASSMFTFWALQNLRQQFLLLFFPIPAWVLLV